MMSNISISVLRRHDGVKIVLKIEPPLPNQMTALNSSNEVPGESSSPIAGTEPSADPPQLTSEVTENIDIVDDEHDAPPQLELEAVEVEECVAPPVPTLEAIEVEEYIAPPVPTLEAIKVEEYIAPPVPTLEAIEVEEYIAPPVPTLEAIKVEECVDRKNNARTSVKKLKTFVTEASCSETISCTKVSVCNVSTTEKRKVPYKLRSQVKEKAKRCRRC